MQAGRVNRRQFAAALAAAAAGVAAPALRAQQRPERARIGIAVAGKPLLDHLPLTIADQLGYFRSEGLEVEITDLAEVPRVPLAVAAGAAEVGCSGFEHTILGQGRGQALQAFVLQGRAPQVAVGVSTRSLPNFRNVAELRGRRIGVSAPGSSASLVANAVLARAGIRSGEVSFVGVGTAAGALAALRTGHVDALANSDPVMTLLEHRGEVRIISDTRSLKGTQEVFGGPMPASCLYAPPEWVARHPATCQALANAIVHALKWLQTAGPSDIIKTVPEAYLMGDRALYLASFNKVRETISPDGLLAEEGVRTALRAVASYEPQLRPERVELGRTWTNEFARRAKDRFKA